MKQKTEKQIRAKEIGDSLLSVQMEEQETKEFKGGWDERLTTVKYEICLINGIKWIVLSDLNYKMNTYLRKMKADGLINDHHILHAKTLTKLTGASSGQTRWQTRTLVQLSVIAACKDELMGRRYLFHPQYHYERNVEAIIESALDAEVKTENFFKGEEMVENERLYAERCRLIAEHNQEKREQFYDEQYGSHEEPKPSEQPTETEQEKTSEDGDSLKSIAFLADKMAEIIGENQNLRKQIELCEAKNACLEKIVNNYEKIEANRQYEIERLKSLCDRICKVNDKLIEELRQKNKLLAQKG